MPLGQLSAAGRSSAMFFFWDLNPTTQGFSPVYVFFVRVGGGGTYLLKNMASSSRMARKRFFVLSFDMVCSYLSTSIYDNCVVGLDFFLDCLQPTEFLVNRIITHGRLQPKEIAPM